MITDAAQRFRSMQSGAAELLPSTPLLNVALGRGTEHAAVAASAALVLATAVRRAERPGWDVVATDVHGLPRTGSRTAATSHGTWATHQACGAIAKLRPGSGMISNFGQGTEVTRRRAVISLTDVLPDGQDVTYWFR